ncbi:unnamed protein product [Miscanthus lutarioriparius]|uniref:Uncharacterized protein n=1 Tax=Miscanthus lutarioriparius TaxID=422564 RepID=A0A811QMC3_9POAL|nr:unnamed protein product [Miscanthus lutarioriparius]
MERAGADPGQVPAVRVEWQCCSTRIVARGRGHAIYVSFLAGRNHRAEVAVTILTGQNHCVGAWFRTPGNLRTLVFILFSDGSIFVLCPVVPFGSDYSKKHIQEIYEDVNAFGLKSSNPNVVTNSHLAIAWLEATFPDLLHQSTDTSFLMSKGHAYAPVDDSLTLQGPLCRVCEESNESEGKNSSCEGKAVGFMYSSAGKDSVLVTAWGSGQLQIDALADEIQPQWNIGVPSRLNVDSHGQIKSVAMICDSNSQDPLALRSHRPSSTGSNVKSNIEAVWMGNSPPLLRLAIVDLALPKTPNDNSLSLFPDPLVPERFYCARGGGLDMVTQHFLPFSYPEMSSTPPSVHPVLTTGNSETSSPFLSGFVTIADAYGHVQLVGITCLGECFVVEMKGWKEPTPLQLDIESKSTKDVEPPATGMISKELIAGPDPPILPSSSSLKSLTPDSIEGKSTLHHYIKVFHEYYVEYGHKAVKHVIWNKNPVLVSIHLSHLLFLKTKHRQGRPSAGQGSGSLAAVLSRVGAWGSEGAAGQRGFECSCEGGPMTATQPRRELARGGPSSARGVTGHSGQCGNLEGRAAQAHKWKGEEPRVARARMSSTPSRGAYARQAEEGAAPWSSRNGAAVELTTDGQEA